MPRKKELPAPDSGEQDDLLSAETQELSRRAAHRTAGGAHPHRKSAR